MSNKLEPIEIATKAFSKERIKLVDIVIGLNDAIEKLKRKAMPELKLAVDATAEAQAKLQQLLKDNKGLFERPRTVIFHGIKIGFKKQVGKIEIKDEEKTIALIRKQFPEIADVVIVKREAISKEALANVSVDTLKKIGCTVIADTDAVVIKATDTEVEKVVTAFLKTAQDEVETV
jgi:arsenate reductase-like glutaredoxin family protein